MRSAVVILVLMASFFFIGDAPAQTVCSGNGDPTDLSCGLSGWWQLNNAASGTCSGTTVVDSSGNGLTGTCTGSPAWTTAGQNNSDALVFPGGSLSDQAGGYVVLPATSLNITGALSVSAWVNPSVTPPTSSGSEIIMVKGGANNVASSEQYLLKATSNGTFVFEVSNGTSVLNASSGVLPAVGTWYHVVGVYDGAGTISIYVDNYPENSSTVSGFGNLNSVASSQGAYIGSDAWGRPWTGSIYSVRVYDRALSNSEVSAIYSSEGGLTVSNPGSGNGSGSSSGSGSGSGSGTCTGNALTVNKSGSGSCNYTTIQAAANAAVAGDTITVEPGVYPESIILNSSGTQGNPIQLIADNASGQVVIDGADPLATGWTPCLSQQLCGGNPNWQNIYTNFITLNPLGNVTNANSTPPTPTAFGISLFQNGNLLYWSESPSPVTPFHFDEISNFNQIPDTQMTTTSISDPTYFNQADPNWPVTQVLLETVFPDPPAPYTESSYGDAIFNWLRTNNYIDVNGYITVDLTSQVFLTALSAQLSNFPNGYQILLSILMQAKSYWVGSYVLAWVQPNDVAYGKITRYNQATNTVTFTNLGASPYTDRNEFYATINSIHDLNKQGEYCTLELDPTHGQVFVWPNGTITDPAQLNISMADRWQGIDIAGQSHWVIQGFTFEHQSADLNQWNGGVAIRNSASESNVPPATDIVIKDNVITNLRSMPGESTLFLSNMTDTLIDSNDINQDFVSGGIFVSEPSNTITIPTSGEYTISNNDIFTITRVGIILQGWVQQSKVLYNRLHDIQGTHSNALSIYENDSGIDVENNVIWEAFRPLTFQASTNLTFINNIFAAGGTSPQGSEEWANDTGLETTGTISFYDNVFVGGTGDSTGKNDISLGIGQVPGINYILANNVIDGLGWATSSTANITHNNNFFTGISYEQANTTPNSSNPNINYYGWPLVDTADLFNTKSESAANIMSGLFVNPVLTVDQSQPVDILDPAPPNFHLLAGSPPANPNPAIGAGANLTTAFATARALAQDLNGNPVISSTLDLDGNQRPFSNGWDIGAYDYEPPVGVSTVLSFSQDDINNNGTLVLTNLTATSTTTSITLTNSSGISAGNTAVALIGWEAGSAMVISSVTDSQGNSWKVQGQQLDDSVHQEGFISGYMAKGLGAADTITVTWTSAAANTTKMAGRLFSLSGTDPSNAPAVFLKQSYGASVSMSEPVNLAHTISMGILNTQWHVSNSNPPVQIVYSGSNWTNPANAGFAYSTADDTSGLLNSYVYTLTNTAGSYDPGGTYNYTASWQGIWAVFNTLGTGNSPPSSVTYGDANNDGSVTLYDAELTAQKAVGLPMAAFNSANAEVDGIALVDIYDAFLIAEYAGVSITQFPVQ